MRRSKPSTPDTPSSQPERDRVSDWSEMSDRRCGHCGAPLTPRGCRSCALELARISNRWRAPVPLGDTQPLSEITGGDGEGEPSTQADAVASPAHEDGAPTMSREPRRR